MTIRHMPYCGYDSYPPGGRHFSRLRLILAAFIGLAVLALVALWYLP